MVYILSKKMRSRLCCNEKIVPKRNHGKPLDRKDTSSDTRSPLSPICATLLYIFGVIGRNDVFARLGVVHDGLGVWEEFIEAPVEEAGGNEGVDVADAETAQVDMLASPTKLLSM